MSSAYMSEFFCDMLLNIARNIEGLKKVVASNNFSAVADNVSTLNTKGNVVVGIARICDIMPNARLSSQPLTTFLCKYHKQLSHVIVKTAHTCNGSWFPSIMGQTKEACGMKT